MKEFPYKNIIVLGFGISSKGVMKELGKRRIDYKLCIDLTNCNLYNVDLIIKSPGISYQEDIIKRALKENIKIITDIELCYMLYPDKYYIGITGTNGKTTTTKLAYEMLKDDLDVGVGGNIGVSVFDIIHHETILLELSSFQLMGIDCFKPNIGMILNISSAHLDYHKDSLEYYNSKVKMIENMDDKSLLIYNSNLDLRLPVNSKAFNDLENSYMVEDNIFYREELIINKKDIFLIGTHNCENILAAITLCKELCISNMKIRNVLKTFKGVEHRLELIYDKGIKVYNDSKSTNPVSTLKALNAMDCPVSLIMGGLDRSDDFSILKGSLSKIEKVYVYGESKNILYDFFLENKINVKKVQSIKKAAKLFKEYAKANDILLLSPGCASWDRYISYAKRGEEFKKIILKLTPFQT